MAFDDDKARFFVQGQSGSTPSGGRAGLPTHSQNEVTPLLMGSDYFAALKAAIDGLGSGGNPFIYMTGWWFTPLFSLDAQNGADKLTDLLKAKSAAGVDVRVMGWVLCPELMMNTTIQAQASDAYRTSYGTMRFIRDLRGEASLADKAILNVLSHPAGAVHTKMAIIGNDTQATVFTGGIDCVNDRHDANWRDVQVRMTGPAVRGAFEFFRDMWNENHARPVTSMHFSVDLGGPRNHAIRLDNHTSGMPDLPQRTVGAATAGTIHAQSARTVPQMSFFQVFGLSPIPTNAALSFAPNGQFDTDRAWRRAIGAAGSYYYVEDQMLSSGEMCDALNARIRADDDFRVILLTGRADPNDPPNSVFDWLRARAMNHRLYHALNAAQKARIGLFNLSTKVVHSKIAIADDMWAYIGSGNFATRSQYTDFEHGYGFMDASGTAVPAFRQQMWDDLFGAAEADPTAAVDRWFAIAEGGSGGAGNAIQRFTPPVPMPQISAMEEFAADAIFDVDSRQVWGSNFFTLLMPGSAIGGGGAGGGS